LLLAAAQFPNLHRVFVNSIFLDARAVSSLEAKGHRHEHHDHLPRSRPEVLEMTISVIRDNQGDHPDGSRKNRRVLIFARSPRGRVILHGRERKSHHSDPQRFRPECQLRLVEKWGWKKLWDWGAPPTFGAVGSG